jgi:hypothetical protein
MMIAVATQLHPVTEQAAELTGVHVELARKRRLVDGDVSFEELCNDSRPYREG